MEIGGGWGLEKDERRDVDENFVEIVLLVRDLGGDWVDAGACGGLVGNSGSVGGGVFGGVFAGVS